MSRNSALPWHVAPFDTVEGRLIANQNGYIEINDANARLIVEAVNQHEALKRERDEALAGHTKAAACLVECNEVVAGLVEQRDALLVLVQTAKGYLDRALPFGDVDVGVVADGAEILMAHGTLCAAIALCQEEKNG